MQILPAKLEDAATLTEIAFAAKRHWGYSERWIEAWRDILTIRPEFIANNENYVADEGAQVVGFYGLVRQLSQMSLEHLWVLPEFMGKGIGRALFNHAIDRAHALGFESILIESDPNAEGFYKRMGARLVGSSVSELDGQRRELPLLIMNCTPHGHKA
jgi:GNAT superfamily N-acetyltransferase